MPLVFAYGSNLSHRQMAERCPSARLTGVARLPGYRLTFTGWSERWGGGVATIEAAHRATVHGAIWHMHDRDLYRLDAYEGAPHFYARKCWVYDGAPVHVYIRAVRQVTVPGPAYVATIKAGCRESRISTRPLQAALRRAKRAAMLAEYIRTMEEEWTE